ncbi:junctional adhesion molecule A isoform X1 [Mixophyes fleayi]|uniref:junctional adhesion molecule A isoform X1 n=1 Tax=Mixophyes fleayi TaxID=3061075 RepID=UPI003F4DF875
MESGKWGVLGVLSLYLYAAVSGEDTIQVKEGSIAEFKCNYPSSLQNPRVEWKFNSGPDTGFVYYGGSLTDSYKDRAVFYLQGLQLKSVTRKDSGDYVCEVTGMDSTGKPVYQDYKTKLVVLVPPSVPVAQVPTSVTTGSRAELVCNERDSSPPAIFVWYKDKIRLPENPKSSPTFQNSSYTIDPVSGVLVYNSVMKSDAGEYFCEAINTEGKQVSAVVHMDVNAAVSGEDTIQVKEGSIAEFKCNYPSTVQNPRVEWKFYSGQENVFVYYDGSLADSYKDRAVFYLQGLQLKSVTRKDSGDYVCEVTATDSTGKPVYQDYKTKLVVLVPPSVPVAQVPTSVTTGSRAELVCNERDSSPPATIVWYKDKIPMPANPKTSPTFQNSSYTIDPSSGVLTYNSVMKSDAGEYYCEATNSEGKQVSAAVRMDVKDVNVGGIVAAVIISLLILGLIAFAVWFAYHRGYIGGESVGVMYIV